MATNAGAKFYIAVDANDDALSQPSNLTQAQFEALEWLEVKGIGTMGETGTTTNIVTYDTLADDVTQKGKGLSNAGDPVIEVKRLGTDAGQAQMRAAGLTKLNYAFKYEIDDAPNATGTGTIFYNRGLVTGPLTLNGGNEDFVRQSYTLGLNQREIEVEAEAGTP